MPIVVRRTQIFAIANIEWRLLSRSAAGYNTGCNF